VSLVVRGGNRWCLHQHDRTPVGQGCRSLARWLDLRRCRGRARSGPLAGARSALHAPAGTSRAQGTWSWAEQLAAAFVRLDALLPARDWHSGATSRTIRAKGRSCRGQARRTIGQLSSLGIARRVTAAPNSSGSAGMDGAVWGSDLGPRCGNSPAGLHLTYQPRREERCANDRRGDGEHRFRSTPRRPWQCPAWTAPVPLREEVGQLRNTLPGIAMNARLSACHSSFALRLSQRQAFRLREKLVGIPGFRALQRTVGSSRVPRQEHCW
jgi:hypothetical protein